MVFVIHPLFEHSKWSKAFNGRLWEQQHTNILVDHIFEHPDGPKVRGAVDDFSGPNGVVSQPAFVF